MKIIRCDQELETPHIDRTLRAWGHDLTLIPENIDEDELCAAMTGCELLLMCYTPITSRVIASSPALRGIVKYGVGIDAIDIPAAHARGVAVVNIPTYAEETVAEGAFALLLALAKKLPSIQRAVLRQGWVWPMTSWLGTDIAGKTLGIVGCGKIGSSMARMAGNGFRARVVGYDPNKSAMDMQEHGIDSYDNLHAMLEIFTSSRCTPP